MGAFTFKYMEVKWFPVILDFLPVNMFAGLNIGQFHSFVCC